MKKPSIADTNSNAFFISISASEYILVWVTRLVHIIIVYRRNRRTYITVSSRVGDQLQVKITDFGLAKGSLLVSTAQMRTKAGTPCFMAPEVTEGKGYDESVDVFALGLVFLTLVNVKKGEKMLRPQIG